VLHIDGLPTSIGLYTIHLKHVATKHHKKNQPNLVNDDANIENMKTDVIVIKGA
jgi:hypothetical protein